MADALQALAKRMVGSRTIGFVGAGYSARSGYPTWGKLLDELYERARLYRDDLPSPADHDADKRWLAEVYANELMRHRSLTDVLRESFESSAAESDLDRLQMLVAKLPFRHYITTNYDGLLEQACDSVFEVVRQQEPSDWQRCIPRDGRVDSQFSDFLGSLADDRRSVLHLHGRLGGHQLTLSMGEYDKQYLHDAMLLRMFSIFATSTVVFIGASLYDADMMELLRRSTFHTNGRCRHYAFLPNARERDSEMLRTSFGVEPILYDIPDGDKSDHSDLERRLEQLLELVESLSTDEDAARGNVTPVRANHGTEFDDEVEGVKDVIRTTEQGPATFRLARSLGIEKGGVAGSRVLRRVAADYRELPDTYRFRHVVWISPGRIGLFPGERSREVVDAIIGEITSSLGPERATATVDRHQNIRSIRAILGDTRWNPEHEPALFVADGSEDLRREAGDDELALASLLYALPRESVAIYEEPPSGDERDRAVDGTGRRKEPPAWARNDFTAELDELFADAPDAPVVAAADPADAPIVSADDPTDAHDATIVSEDDPDDALADAIAGTDDTPPGTENDATADAWEASPTPAPEQPAPDVPASPVADNEQRGGDERRAAAALERERLDNEQRVLVALCVVATPISSDQLTTILKMDKHEIERTIGALRERGLIESPSRPAPLADLRIAAPDEDVPEPDAIDIGLLNPVRAATLRLLYSGEGAPKQVVLDVVATILGWAEGTLERLNHWEDDNEQLKELIEHLPNLLAVFEAGCWLGSAGDYQTSAIANCRLWLGTDLAYVLYNVGRWAETGQMLRYLLGACEAVTEPETFRREVLVLLAAFYGHAGRPESDYRVAEEHADEAIRLAQEAIKRGRPEPNTSGGGLTYAPARLTPERQKARAELWRSHALIRGLGNMDDRLLASKLDGATDDKQYHDAEADLERIWEGGFDNDEERKHQAESRKIVADASQALAELRLLQLRSRRAHMAPIANLDEENQDARRLDEEPWLRHTLKELDKGRETAQLVRSRPRGYIAKLRGEMLLEYGNHAAARRCFARVLLISYEFKDRYLEAAARLGLARCDQQRSLARKAAEIFKDLRRLPEMKEAERWSWNPSLSGRHRPVLRQYPKLVVIVGVPGSGKSAAVAEASSALGAWGFDPILAQFAPTLIERIRSQDKIDLARVPLEIEKQYRIGNDDTEASRHVVIAKVPTGRLRDLFMKWLDNPFQMRAMLCIHLTASGDVLKMRNEQRRAGQLPADRLDRMIEDEGAQTAEQVLAYSSWETWFQCNRSAYVSIDAEAPITEFEHRIRDALALSYLTVDDLIEASSHRFS